jgi:hypothetical protein
VRPALSIVAVAALVAALAACDDDGAGDVEEFCADVAANVDPLRAVPQTDDAVDDLINLWQDIGDAAPLAIEEEWDRHADNLDLAWTSDDQQEVLASTFAAERSAVAIADWLEQNCGIDFGPVTTIVPATITTTTVPGATTVAGAATTTTTG